MPTITNFIPEIWSQEMNFALRKSLVGLSTVNMDYEGEIATAGDTVHINRPEAISVGTYTPGSDITVEVPSSSQLDLVIDQFKYWAFEVDDVYRVQANVNLMQPYVSEAAYAMSDQVDSWLFGFFTYSDSSNAITAVTLTSSNIWTQLTEAKRVLSVNSVPSTGRWMAVSPAEIQLLEQSTAFQRASDLGDTVSRNGFAGRAGGFDILETNNLTEGGNRRNIMFGHDIATTMAFQFANTERQRRELRFSDLVKGLLLYGAKTIKPKAIGKLVAKIS